MATALKKEAKVEIFNKEGEVIRTYQDVENLKVHENYTTFEHSIGKTTATNMDFIFEYDE
jgi:hypothetical protein